MASRIAAVVVRRNDEGIARHGAAAGAAGGSGAAAGAAGGPEDRNAPDAFLFISYHGPRGGSAKGPARAREDDRARFSRYLVSIWSMLVAEFSLTTCIVGADWNEETSAEATAAVNQEAVRVVAPEVQGEFRHDGRPPIDRFLWIINQKKRPAFDLTMVERPAVISRNRDSEPFVQLRDVLHNGRGHRPVRAVLQFSQDNPYT